MVAAVTATAVSVAGCSASDGQAGEDGPASIRIGWFGNDVRNASLQEAIKAFEKANPDINVSAEYTPFDSYADKLATQFAANDAPDVVMIPETHLGEYADRGALQELGDDIATTGFAESSIEAGETAEGRFGITAGLNAMAIMANPNVLKQADVAVPDDSSWTWADYSDVASQVTSGSDGESYGSGAPNFGPALELWLRQSGKSLYTDDGSLGFVASDAVSYFDYLASLRSTEAIPRASVIVEDLRGLEQSGLATKRDALGWFWSSAVGAVNAASGEQMQLLMPPSDGGGADDAGLYVKADSLWAVNARTEESGAAKQLIDFLVNDPVAGEKLLTNLGVPPNEEVRAEVQDDLDESSAASVEYVDRVTEVVDVARPTVPAGGGVFDATMLRISMDVLFERLSSDEAAEQLVTELEAAIRG